MLSESESVQYVPVLTALDVLVPVVPGSIVVVAANKKVAEINTIDKIDKTTKKFRTELNLNDNINIYNDNRITLFINVLILNSLHE